MKKFFEKTIKFLFDTALIAIMLVSAQHAMNLPLGWACFGYGAIFCAALTVWSKVKVINGDFYWINNNINYINLRIITD